MVTQKEIVIQPAENVEDFRRLARLYGEELQAMGVSIGFQQFEEELNS